VESFLYTIAVLACPAGMGLMMWMMTRRGTGADDTSKQVQLLRAEVEQLKAEPAARRTGEPS